MTFNMEELKQGCLSLGINLSDYQLNQFFTFYDCMIEKNKVMNLTTITDMNEVIHKHYVDSLSMCKVIDMSKIHSLADMGTGAGFPGIPLKIVYPEIQMTLMDSLQKRLNYLEEVIGELHLTNINLVHGRAEDIGRTSIYREKFDLVTSRAVANLSTLSEYCLPLVKKKGYFVSYKGGHVSEELEDARKAIHLLGGGQAEVVSFQLPFQEDERTLIKIQKEKLTPVKFPRKAGIPSKEPLK